MLQMHGSALRTVDVFHHEFLREKYDLAFRLDFKVSWKGDDCRLTRGDNSPDFLERVIHKNRSKGISSLPRIYRSFKRISRIFGPLKIEINEG